MTKSIAIIGGGIAGLAVARAIKHRAAQQQEWEGRRGDNGNGSLRTVVFEASLSERAAWGGVSGEINLIGGRELMAALGLSDEWRAIPRRSDASSEDMISRKSLLRVLRDSLDDGTVQEGVQVEGLVNSGYPNGRLCCLLRKTQQGRGNGGGARLQNDRSVEEQVAVTKSEPFDVVIGAAGLTSDVRAWASAVCTRGNEEGLGATKTSSSQQAGHSNRKDDYNKHRLNHGCVLLVGDARRMHRGEWDFGYGRIVYGAGQALRDAAELAGALIDDCDEGGHEASAAGAVGQWGRWWGHSRHGLDVFSAVHTQQQLVAATILRAAAHLMIVAVAWRIATAA